MPAPGFGCFAASGPGPCPCSVPWSAAAHPCHDSGSAAAGPESGSVAVLAPCPVRGFSPCAPAPGPDPGPCGEVGRGPAWVRRAEVCGRAPPGDCPLPRKPVPDLTSHHSGRCHPDQNAGCSHRPHLFWCHPGHLLGEGQTDRERVSGAWTTGNQKHPRAKGRTPSLLVTVGPSTVRTLCLHSLNVLLKSADSQSASQKTHVTRPQSSCSQPGAPHTVSSQIILTRSHSHLPN